MDTEECRTRKKCRRIDDLHMDFPGNFPFTYCASSNLYRDCEPGILVLCSNHLLLGVECQYEASGSHCALLV